MIRMLKLIFLIHIYICTHLVNEAEALKERVAEVEKKAGSFHRQGKKTLIQKYSKVIVSHGNPLKRNAAADVDQGNCNYRHHRIGATRKRERSLSLINNTMEEYQTTSSSLLPLPPCLVQKQRSHVNDSESGRIPFFIPDELLVEILSRLPVKSLLRFRIILSATTAEFHLKSCSVSSLFNNPSTTVSEDLNYPVKNKFRHDGIVGSCNGLLCFAIKGDCVLLWNPSTRVSKKSPPLGNNWRPGCFTAFGLGYDHITEDYKVVAVFCDPNEFFSESKVKVYSMATNSWRKIQDFPHGVSPYQNSGKFVSGTLNWAANYSVFGSSSSSLWVIVSLDLHKETYREVLLPPPDYEKEDCSTPTLGVLKGCLCLNYDYKRTDFVVWVMKEYGVRESWVKLVTVPYLPNPEDFSYSGPYCISENGEVLLMFEFDLIIYDPRDHSFRYPRIENGKGWFDAEVYVETLVSPMKH